MGGAEQGKTRPGRDGGEEREDEGEERGRGLGNGDDERPVFWGQKNREQKKKR
jgi:hypothetical protein